MGRMLQLFRLSSLEKIKGSTSQAIWDGLVPRTHGWDLRRDALPCDFPLYLYMHITIQMEVSWSGTFKKKIKVLNFGNGN